MCLFFREICQFSATGKCAASVSSRSADHEIYRVEHGIFTVDRLVKLGVFSRSGRGPCGGAAPQHFILFFRFESDELTDESRAVLPQVLRAVKNRPVPEVAVVGHTDTMGTAASNIELGLRRANAIRSVLIDAGVDAALIEATSHGEADLLVKTTDEVPEPRNRRVDITVK